eukprot:3712775-Amphidinium_carterae.1
MTSAVLRLAGVLETLPNAISLDALKKSHQEVLACIAPSFRHQNLCQRLVKRLTCTWRTARILNWAQLHSMDRHGKVRALFATSLPSPKERLQGCDVLPWRNISIRDPLIFLCILLHVEAGHLMVVPYNGLSTSEISKKWVAEPLL